jgi:hypothetical protein
VRQQIDQGVDPALGLEKFIQYDHLFLLKYAIAALKSTPLIPHYVACLFNQFLNLVQGGRIILNTHVRLFTKVLNPRHLPFAVS